MKYLKVTHEGNDSVSFEVRDSMTMIKREFTLIFKPHPDGSVTLLKQVDFPVEVKDFSYEGMEA